MSYFFKVDGIRVRVSPEILIIYPFSKIWERDKSKDKGRAINDLSYIEFMVSEFNTNPFKNYDNKERDIRIREDVIRNKLWKCDKLVKDGIEKLKEYNENNSDNYRYYMAAKTGVNKLRDYCDKFNIDERDEKGSVVWKVNDLKSALSGLEPAVKNLEKLRDAMYKDLEDNAMIRGGKDVGYFATTDSLNNKI